MKMKKARRLISILMLLTIMVSVPATSVHAEGNVGRVVQGKVGTISQAYTGGNSQVYANLITKADGTEVRYVYSNNYLCSNSPEDTFAALKSVLTADYAALIPDSVDASLNGSVGFFFCSDPSLEQYVNDNWTSAEYVARNVLTIPEEGMSYSYKREENGAGGAVNTSATAAWKNNRFEWIKTLAEAGHIARWEAFEEQRKMAWDAAEAEKKEEDPNYIPQQYQPSTYVPLDFGDLTGDDIQGTRDLTSSQIDLAVGCNLTTDYSLEQGRLVELTNIEIIDHVTSIYSDNVIISESSSYDEEKKQDEPVKPNEPDTPAKTVDMYRLYNPNSGEHFYTANATEKDNLVSLGWKYEGVGWKAPATSNTPVYRVYNPNAGDHHYTTNKAEIDFLVSVGWNDEGIGWYSDDAKSVALYRQYNPNAVTGAHNFTSSKGENDWLVSVGWKDEGIGCYGVK